MKTGRVELYSKEGDFLKSYAYWSVWDRKRVFKKLEKMYGEKFYSCYYHIVPNAWGRVSLNGENMHAQAPKGKETPSSLRELIMV